MSTKPLGGRAYGSIPCLPGSRMAKDDKGATPGMAKLCWEKSTKNHWVYAEQKMDGSCCAVAKVNGLIVPLTRAGYRAETSPYRQHHYFAKWVMKRYTEFEKLLDEGERIVGEWMLQAHGTKYEIPNLDYLFRPFDIFSDYGTRLLRRPFYKRLYLYDGVRKGKLNLPPVPMAHANKSGLPHDELAQQIIEAGREGIVYRVEDHRKDKVLFLAKWVRPDYEPGKYLPEISGGEPVWNYDPNKI